MSVPLHNTFYLSAWLTVPYGWSDAYLKQVISEAISGATQQQVKLANIALTLRVE
jgi:hypothetical protein